MSRKLKNKGDSNFIYIFSIVKGAFFAVWCFAYVVCLALRSNAFSNAQKSLSLSGYTTYTIEVTSPFFGVLKALAMLIPVAVIIWIISLYKKDKYSKLPIEKLFPLISFGVDVVAAFICLLDITVFHMIF